MKKITEKQLRHIISECIKTSLNELQAWHGSKANFNKFDSKFIGSGTGLSTFGWGVYVTTSQETGQAYAQEVEANGEKYLYTVDIPDDNGRNYINIQGNNPNVYNYIQQALTKAKPDAASDIQWCLDYCRENDSLTWLFQNRCEFFFTPEELSKALLNAGIVGVRVPVNFEGQNGVVGVGNNGYNYTIFDANQVRILQKQRYGNNTQQQYQAVSENVHK